MLTKAEARIVPTSRQCLGDIGGPLEVGAKNAGKTVMYLDRSQHIQCLQIMQHCATG